MYDQVTLKLNVDPWIISALKEDITSEDVSTNSVMPHPQAGEVDLICKEDGIICGLQVFERVFTLLDEKTTVEFWCRMEQKFIRDSLWQKCMAISDPFMRRAYRTELSAAYERNCNLHTFRGRIIKRNRNQTSGYQKDNTKQSYF